MQDFIGSVRRSLVFKPFGGPDDGGIGLGGFVEKIGSSVRKSRVGIFSKPPVSALPSVMRAEGMQEQNDAVPKIRWRKGELIGCGAFGRVYMGMNLDSGELIAVKEVSIAASSASKERTKAHIIELEEEVNLLKNLSHLNIVRYLGTAREEESFNILLEFVPGGSISSLLGKFGSFPETVIRMYTKQLLLGLEYLHKNGIMHRDIKGANILVDNKGCIKLADFGASKKVVELATITGSKSMKGTPYWMAPEVILQTGHSFSADIWSVGCTIIEMATGKPPWSQQYQEVAALFHIGTTKSHPPIPEHLSDGAKDFLLKCLQEKPNLRPSASDLLQHPFVTKEYQETHPVFCNSLMLNNSGNRIYLGADIRKSMNPELRTTCTVLKEVCDMGAARRSNIYSELSENGYIWKSNNFDDDMCQIDDKDDFVGGGSAKLSSTLLLDDFCKSFNPMCEPIDDLSSKFDENPELEKSQSSLFSAKKFARPSDNVRASGKIDFSFPSRPLVSEDDDEVTELKIRAFLDEKALDLKKLQTPLYKEFYNSGNAALPPSPVEATNKENFPSNLNLPPKSRSPNQVISRRLSSAAEVDFMASPGCPSGRVSNVGISKDKISQELPSLEVNEWKKLLQDSQQEVITPSSSFSERQRKWKAELDEELERKREIMRQAAVVKTSSPKDRITSRQRD